ncbi:MAG: RNA pyrophosphohydrolase [Holosporales bacterium]|jgi:putative (di)nucleoside polyphosphate hydrolase|nr:RNA pyrophosphohydrolase [Holosporales bacterium]
MGSVNDDRLRDGVGMILINNDNKVFVGKRNSVNTKMMSWFLKRPWQMPQGGIEAGENPLEAVMRELREEVGTDNVEMLGETDDWLRYIVPTGLRRKDSKFIGQRQKWFLLKFLGENSDINLNATNHKEFDVWRWMSVGNVIRLAVHFKRSLYVEAFRRFSWYFGNISPRNKEQQNDNQINE